MPVSTQQKIVKRRLFLRVPGLMTFQRHSRVENFPEISGILISCRGRALSDRRRSSQAQNTDSTCNRIAVRFPEIFKKIGLTCDKPNKPAQNSVLQRTSLHEKRVSVINRFLKGLFSFPSFQPSLHLFRQAHEPAGQKDDGKDKHDADNDIPSEGEPG